MEKRLELEMRGRKPAEVTELNLDNCRATQMAGLNDEFSNLEALSLINVGLTTLKGFPNLPNLKRLEMSDNRITGGLEHLQGCANITHLNLSGNKIKDVESLAPLAELKQLKALDLFNNDVTQAEDYREKTFELVAHLKYLDGFDKDDREADESDDDAINDEDEEDLENDVDEGEDEVSDDDEGDEDEEGDSEVGLEYLQSSNVLKDEDETEDYAGEDGEDGEDDDVPDEDDEDDDEDPDASKDTDDGARGIKRKHEEEEEENGE